MIFAAVKKLICLVQPGIVLVPWKCGKLGANLFAEMPCCVSLFIWVHPMQSAYNTDRCQGKYIDTEAIETSSIGA